MELALIMLGLLALAPMASAAPPSDDANARCQGDGHLSVTTPDGQGFKRVGQCMKHVTQGGGLVERPRLIITFSKPVHGRLTVEVSSVGLQAGAFLYVDSDVTAPIDVGVVDSAGNLAFGRGDYCCGTFDWLECSRLD